MTFAKPILLMIPILLAGCQPDPFSPNPDDRAACLAEGGDYREGGLSGYFCFTPTGYEGVSCSGPSDCGGNACIVGLDSPGGPGTCTAQTPLFGCHTFVEDNGERLDICID